MTDQPAQSLLVLSAYKRKKKKKKELKMKDSKTANKIWRSMQHSLEMSPHGLITHC